MATYSIANYKQLFIRELPPLDNTLKKKKSIFNYSLSGLLLIVVFVCFFDFKFLSDQNILPSLIMIPPLFVCLFLEDRYGAETRNSQSFW